MSSGFPPIPLYPLGFDTDYTLFKVYNTTETTITQNNEAWAEEIWIKPQAAGRPEIWADNGFANIGGELLYYDAVDKDTNGNVYKLKRCLRNLGGTHTHFNPAGTWIRSFVVAEHHEQVVNTILLLENFIGENFSPNPPTLDWRIRHLAAEPIIFDDFGCPDVVFDFAILSSDPATGTIARYAVTVTGGVGELLVQFGDGTSTTNPSGTHSYPPNAVIDPSVMVTNQNCQIIQTPIVRDEVKEPTFPAPPPPFELPVPIPLDLPPLVVPSVPLPSVDLFTPQIQFPCIDLSPLSNLSFPSIVIPSFNINFPSTISVVPPVISFSPAPSFSPVPFSPSPTFSPVPFSPSPTFSPVPFSPAPTFSPIPFGPAPVVYFGPAPQVGPVFFGPAPSFAPIRISCCTISVQPISCCTISFAPVPTFKPISFATPPSFGLVSFAPPSFGLVSFAEPPRISVVWGTPPTICVACSCTVLCPSATKPLAAAARFGLDGEFLNDDQVEVQYDMVGFPTEIKVVAPEIPPLKIEHDIPRSIAVEMPTEIKLVAQQPIPNEIRFLLPEVPNWNVLSLAPPPPLKLDVENIAIPILAPANMPKIIIDAAAVPSEIRVVGMPDVISVAMRDFVELKIPENVKIPLVFEGPPLSAEVKITIDIDRLTGDAAEGIQCVAIVPCPRK